MIAVISPAKTIDMHKGPKVSSATSPIFCEEASILMKELKSYSVEDIIQLMGVSRKLAELNYDRFQNWLTIPSDDMTRQALFAFRGDVYSGIGADDLSKSELNYLKEKLRILSGLYGILKPFDLIQPYRLEMGISMKFDVYKDLYAFWRDKITLYLRDEFARMKQENRVLVNLASNEYFKSINMKKLGVDVYTPVFKDYKNGAYKIISFYAKKARGRMLSFMAKNSVVNPEDLKAFDLDGYLYNHEMSDKYTFVFTRGF